jgi:ATP-binding cassette subfamily F protein uup
VIVAEGNGLWREYIGGYTDWERVRPAAIPAGSPKGSGKVESKTEAVSSQAAPAAKQKKLSYKEQREIDALPTLIAQLEAEQKAITEKLADASIYTKQADEAKRLNQRFAEIDGLLLDALEKWETIEARAKA